MMLLWNSILLPPGLNILLIIIGLFLQRRGGPWGSGLIIVSLTLLFFFSTAVGARFLLNTLSYQYPTLQSLDNNAEAIVVLTGGSRYAPEYPGKHGPSSSSLMREAYAAYLYQQRPIPIILLGGKGYTGQISESSLMQADLQRTFNVPTFLVETESRNTMENIRHAQVLLDNQQIKRFYLVTSAWHMPRAMSGFKQLGYAPIAAPTDYRISPQHDFHWRAWLPDPRYLLLSSLGLHELWGQCWYWLSKPFSP